MGLNEIHMAGLIHRDLKLDNIFIDDKDILKIGDFGVAITSTILKNLSKIEGTYGFISPEYLFN